MSLTSKTKGFTIIELLVVVAIIGILATVVLASLGSAREKAREARKLTDLNQIRNAFELYYLDNGSYPLATTGGWFAYCIGKSSSETCWNNELNGNDALNAALEDYLPLDYFASLNGADASAFVLHRGGTSNNLGCAGAVRFGNQIVWMPKDNGTVPNNSCPGESIRTGCGSGIYQQTVYHNNHCALLLD